MQADGKSYQQMLVKVALFAILIIIMLIVMASYFWITKDYTSYWRDSGLVVVGGFVGSAVYAAWEKLTSVK